MAATMPLEATTESMDSLIVTPEQAHEPTTSLSNDTGHVYLEKEQADDEAQAEQNIKSSGQEPEFPGFKKVAVIMFALMSAIFLVALDRTIIATAIPKMTDEFHSLDDIGWYGSAFLLTSCCFQLLIGRIYTFYSPKYIFLIIIFVFEIGSAICGAAPNSVTFIIGRAIAGIGSAGITSGTIIILVGIVPLAKRPFYQGFIGACFGVAAVVGPLLGGAFTTYVSWRWCFYINLPIGGAAMAVILFILKPTPVQEKGLTIPQQLVRLDLLGELFLFPCIICLLLALQLGGSTYTWSNWRLIVLWVFFGVLLVAFVAVQVCKQDTATIPASIIKNRSIIAAMWYTFCMASTMLLLVYYIPVWFQAIEGVSAVQSGIRTIPLVLSLVLGSIGAGQIVGRVGYYTPFMIASACIMPIGAGLITTWNLETSEGMWIGYQILLGFGLGIGQQQGPLAAQAVLPRKDIATGVSLMFFCQQLGGAVFVSVGQNVFDSKLVNGLTSVVHGLNPLTVVNTGATDLRNIVPAKDLHLVLVVYNIALKQTFYVATAMAALSIVGALALEWKSVKGNKDEVGKKIWIKRRKQQASQRLT